MKPVFGAMSGMMMAALVVCPQPGAAAEESDAKSRLLVLTDIEADPDDTQSLTRLLLYAGDIDIEGLIATTSVHQKTRVAPESIRAVIASYGKVHGNLVLHDPAYPAAADLDALVGTGQTAYGMESIGLGKDTDGSQRIIAALENPDPRPLWVAVWGGPNTLAQALLTLRATRSSEELERLIAKLRVYAISDQDDSGPWIRTEFPDLFYVVSPGGYMAATWIGMSLTIDGLDNTTISNDWLAANIQQGHGPLGAGYPDVAYGIEGDTPSFLGLIRNGLNAPERPDWGGWGGRYTLRTPARDETDPEGPNGGVPVPQETRPIWTNAIDQITPYVAAPYRASIQPLDRSYSGSTETLWRWRDDFQNDFAARMDWSVKSVEEANHPPVVRLPHADRLTVEPDEQVELSALGTSDPDGDSLTYHWFQYREAGTCQASIELSGAANLYERRFTAPKVDTNCEAHFILKVTDKGSPSLSRYRRVVVSVQPASG